MCPRGRPENVPGTFLERQIRAFLGCHFRTSTEPLIRTSLGCQIEWSLGWSDKIFRGRHGDIWVWRPGEVLGTKNLLPGSFDILDRVIRVYDGARYLSVFAPKKYDAIDNKIRWHISQNGITHVFFHNLVRIQVGSFYSVPLE